MKRRIRRAIAVQTCALSLSIACAGEGDLSEATSDAGIEEADTNLNEDGVSNSGETRTSSTPVRPRPRPEPSVVPSNEPSTEPDIDVSSDDAPAQPSVESEPDPPAPSTTQGPQNPPPPVDAIDERCQVPPEARAEDTSSPDHIIGDGTPQSCTGARVIEAVAQGGVITFDCGPDPVTITLDRPAKVFNDAEPKVVIDGGGLVTLSGGGNNRILYMNTCDEAQVWTTAHCQDQDHPELTVQNLTFIDGNSKAEDEYDGGGAVWVRGGRFKVVNSRFFNNTCADVGPDVGGGALRVFSQYQGQPVYVTGSTFGGSAATGNVCSNGGAISSIDVSWTIFNSQFSHNRAGGNGGNPAQAGTPGGGSGGAIYNDGNTMTLSLCGASIHHNEVNAFGSAIFFVSNDHSGDVRIEESLISDNVGGSWYPTYPQISNHDDTPIHVVSSTIE